MKIRFYAFLYKTLHGFVGDILYPSRVTRACAEPPQGGIILASNHYSGNDILIMMAASRRQIRFMAKKELFHIPLLRTLMRSMGAFPVDRGGSSVSALRTGTELLKEGNVVGIFPQGTRCAGKHPSQTREKLHGGVGLLAQRSHAAIVPVSIFAENYRIGIFKRVSVSFGEPIPYEEYAPLLEEENGRMLVTRMTFERICALFERDRIDAEERRAVKKPSSRKTEPAEETKK